MKDFLHNLYANEKFPVYLGTIIIFLIMLFFVVLFFGRKDKKKLADTKKIDKIDLGALGESKPINLTQETPVEVKVQEQLPPTNVNVVPPVQANTNIVSEPEVVKEDILPVSNVNVVNVPEEPKIDNPPLSMPIENINIVPTMEGADNTSIKQPIQNINESIVSNIEEQEEISNIPTVEEQKEIFSYLNEDKPIDANEADILEKPSISEKDYTVDFNKLANEIDNDLTEMEEQQKDVSINNLEEEDVIELPKLKEIKEEKQPLLTEEQEDKIQI